MYFNPCEWNARPRTHTRHDVTTGNEQIDRAIGIACLYIEVNNVRDGEKSNIGLVSVHFTLYSDLYADNGYIDLRSEYLH
jgi:hypothetical protein